MPERSARTTVSVAPRPLWRLRLREELPRYLLQAAATAGLLASARYAIAPPRPLIVRASGAAVMQVDRAGEGFAELFARRYLTWNAADPEQHRLALAAYLGPQMEAEAGFQPPQSGSQQVLWTQIVQADRSRGAEQYTVAVQTDASGLVYLSVAVVRGSDGSLALAGYPAFVGPPPSAPAATPAHLSEVQTSPLATVVTRALRNYLAASESELAADLAPGASVALPTTPLALESAPNLDWSTDGRSVLALVHARDRAGSTYTLAYRLAVASAAGRWEVSAIEVDPGQ